MENCNTWKRKPMSEKRGWKPTSGNTKAHQK